MNYLLRAGDDVMGTMQVSFTAWFGTGNRFEVYGTAGMLLLATEDSPAWSKESGQGDPARGERIGQISVARTSAGCARKPEIRKFSTARAVSPFSSRSVPTSSRMSDTCALSISTNISFQQNFSIILFQLFFSKACAT